VTEKKKPLQPTDKPRRRRRVVTPENALASCLAALQPLDAKERARVLRTAAAYFEVQPNSGLQFPPGVRSDGI